DVDKKPMEIPVHFKYMLISTKLTGLYTMIKSSLLS
ncbi:hypothetical protein BMETH_30481802871990, partial [methanotrophic bacterial endosymbiont of Bathymodiolus sp.]